MTSRSKTYKTKIMDDLMTGAVTESDEMTRKMTSLMTVPTQFDDDHPETTYKWSLVRDRLGLKSNVANARWMPEKLMPLFEKLDAPMLLAASGKPTQFGCQMLARYKKFVIDSGNDYEEFANQVKACFPSSESKPVSVEILSDDDDDYGDYSNPSFGDSDRALPLQKMHEQVEDRNDDLASKILLAKKARSEAESAIARFQGLSEKSWEQKILEEELERYTKEQEQKKQEVELRLKIRQMLENGAV